MTEPKTVEEIMGLAFRTEAIGRAFLKMTANHKYSAEEYSAAVKEGSEAWQALEAALTALAAERDQAVEENAQRLLDYRRWRDELLKERDALKARVRGL